MRTISLRSAAGSESGYIVEILTEAAFREGKNVLVDGSLRDHEWYSSYFKRIQNEYPTRKIGILHITAPRAMVFERAKKRGESTGRMIPEEILENSLEQVPLSVSILSPLVDFSCEIDNSVISKDDDIKLVKTSTRDLSWDGFNSVWLQTCAWVPKSKRASLQRRENNRLHEVLDGAEL